MMASVCHISSLNFLHHPLHPAHHWTIKCLPPPPARVEVGGGRSWSCEAEIDQEAGNYEVEQELHSGVLTPQDPDAGLSCQLRMED